MKYTYNCKNAAGQVQTGVIEAKNEAEAAKALQAQQLFVLDLKKEGGVTFSSVSRGGFEIPFLSNRVKLKDKIIFTQQLAMMIKAGLPLMDAFGALREQTENKYFANVIGDIASEVKGGKPLSEIIKKYPKIFSNLYISMVTSGEKSGKLDDVLERLATQLQKDYDLYSKIKSAASYPVLVVCALVGIVILMLLFVVPSLKTIFNDMGVTLPITTRIVLGTSDAMRKYWYIFIIVTVGLGIGLHFAAKNPAFGLFWDKSKLRIPIIGNLIKKIYMTRFCRTTGTLVASGLPILSIIDTVKGIIPNRLYKQAFTRISADIEGGIQFSETLKKQHIFPAMIYHLVAVGEKSGKLDYVLLSMADFFDKEVENTTNNLTTIIEPVLIILIGGGVGVVVAAVIMPIYSLVNAI